jgi:hypothetical protein
LLTGVKSFLSQFLLKKRLCRCVVVEGKIPALNE